MILAALLVTFGVLCAWYGLTRWRIGQRQRSLLRAALQYQATPAVRGVLLEKRGADVIPLLQPTERRCPVCQTYHVLHPAIVDDRCAACLSNTFDTAPINPGGGWGAA
jgi:hypothetical protein